MKKIWIAFGLYCAIGFMAYGWAATDPDYCWTEYPSGARSQNDLCVSYTGLYWPLMLPAHFSKLAWQKR